MMLTTPSSCGILILQLLSSPVLPFLPFFPSFLPSFPSLPTFFGVSCRTSLVWLVRPSALPPPAVPLLADLHLVGCCCWALLYHLAPRLVTAVAPVPSAGQRWVALLSSACLPEVGWPAFFFFLSSLPEVALAGLLPVGALVPESCPH